MAGKPGRSGRPSSYDEEVAQEILDRLSSGEPLARICRDAHLPGVQTVYDWKAKRADFSVALARARADGLEAITVDCLEIADNSSGDRKLIGREGEEREVCDTEFVQRSKLRVETRLKLLAIRDPKNYGPKSMVELQGKDGKDLEGPIVNVYLPDNGRS